MAGFCLVSLDVKQKYTNQTHESIKCAKKSILLLFCMKLTSVVCKLEIKINLSKSKVKLHPYSKSICTTKCVISPLFKINMHHQMWNHAPTPTPYAPPNVESRPYSNSICTTCQDLNQGPSACKLSVQTTTPPVLDTILIEQQAIILPR